MVSKVCVTAAVVVLALLTPSAAQAAEAPDLAWAGYSVDAAATPDGTQRGPAIAVMQDGTVLLGGGKAGGEIFSWSLRKKSLKRIASVIPADRRQLDSRFAITDIAVMSQSPSAAKLLVSYPRLGSSRDCVEVVVDQLDYNRVTQKARKAATWFVSKPCVPISAVQHASGRFAVIDANSAYVTVGDLGFSGINDRAVRGDLGSVFKLTATSATKVSQGHRNAQGIVLFDGKTLLTAEHGPRGGDELNLIQQGGDYGWPFVTYGQPYGDGDYVQPLQPGTHYGYLAPLKYWVPSIAPTELVQLPTDGWGQWSRGLVMGTLREQSLVFITLDSSFTPTQTTMVNMGERIRDLDVLPNGAMIASTDSGKLLVMTLRNP